MNEKITVVLGSDHAGLPLKNALKALIENEGYKTVDVGTYTTESCDYPIYAEKTCRALLDGEGSLAILCCGTGIGMSMAANKIKGIRAACCSDIFSAKFTRLHNDANVLCLGARVLGEGLAWEIARAFLETGFEGGKHARRIGLIAELEEKR